MTAQERVRERASRYLYSLGHPLAGGNVLEELFTRELQSAGVVPERATVLARIRETGLPVDYLPPEPALREVLALLVQARRLLERLGLPLARQEEVLVRTWEVGKVFRSPEEVSLLPWERMAFLSREVLHDSGQSETGPGDAHEPSAAPHDPAPPPPGAA